MKELLFSSQGRINRQRYWLAALGTAVVLSAVMAAVIAILWAILPGTVDENGTYKVNGIMAIPYLVIVLAYLVALVWSSICLGIKRYHDINKSGAWILVMFVPLVGSIIYFIQAGCLRGTQGVNQYGSDPLSA